MVANIWQTLKQTGSEWIDDSAPRLGAALAFYSVLSMAPLVVIALAIAGAVFGQDAARGELTTQVHGLIGQQGAEAIQEMIAHAQQPAAGTLAAILGIVTLLLGPAASLGSCKTRSTPFGMYGPNRAAAYGLREGSILLVHAGARDRVFTPPAAHRPVARRVIPRARRLSV